MAAALMRKSLCMAMALAAGSLFAQEHKDSAPAPNVASVTPVAEADVKTSLPPEAQKIAADGVKAYEKGDLEGARKDFQKLLQLVPDNFFTLVNLGGIEYRLKLWGDAEKHLKKAVRLQPESGKAWLALGALYCDRDKLDEA